MEGLIILGMVLTLVASIVGGICWLVSLYSRCPAPLRWHWVTALVWSFIVGNATCVIIASERLSVSAHLVVLVSGLVMVPCWTQLAERRRGETRIQNRRPFLLRLFVQTLWGPLAFCIFMSCTADIRDQLVRDVRQHAVTPSFVSRLSE